MTTPILTISLFHPHDAIAKRAHTPPLSEPQTFSSTPSSIRADTVQLSGILLSPPSTSLATHPSSEIKIDPSTPRTTPGPSALSVLIAESRAGCPESSMSPPRGGSSEKVSPERPSAPATARVLDHTRKDQTATEDNTSTATPRRCPQVQHLISDPRETVPPTSESAPLLGRTHHPIPYTYTSPPALPPRKLDLLARLYSAFNVSRWVERPVPRSPCAVLRETLPTVPAVILGLLLNILDGVSYGMIIFPATGVFSGFGGTGVSMFFVTWVFFSGLLYESCVV